jgi:nucleotide-binding universal stress UspA family protein
MQAFRNILFPADMSDSCTAAAPYVETMARKFQSNITLLHVLEMPPTYFTDWYGYMALADSGAIRDARQDEFDTYLRDRFQGLNVERVMFEGDPAQAVLDYSNTHSSDLIMMPTHGYGVFRRLLLGSVTARILHQAACPVWTSVHLEAAPPPPQTVQKIMCAVDLTKSSVPTLRFAAQLAKEFEAKLWLVHAIPGAETGPEKYFDADLQVFLEQEARKAIAQMQAAEGLSLPVCLGTGDVARVVAEAATHHDVNLVIVGRGHATRLLGPLRTNVHGIIRHSPCPVLSV